MKTRTISLTLAPVMMLFVAAALYSILWTYQPYYRPTMFTPEYAETRNRIFVEFTIVFGTLAVAAAWLVAMALTRRSHLVNLVAGGLALWPVVVFAAGPYGVVTDNTIMLSTLVVTGLSAIVVMWGIVSRQWVLPVCTMGLNILFAGTGYWFMVALVVDMFRD
ncbi:MAG: hypothetical protein HY343_08035 [Lentisphaerae bacterium]|nr:hypothetical protein [Lentisphaerota bacterium]